MKTNKKMYCLRIHPEQIEYLKLIANSNFTTVTQYVLDLINKDMKINQELAKKRLNNE